MNVFKKHIHIGETSQSTNEQMFAAWSESRDQHVGARHLMIATENADVAALNRWAHEKLSSEGELGAESVSVSAIDSTADHPLVNFRPGDEVAFRVNRANLNVFNRTRCTIAAVSGGTITVSVSRHNELEPQLIDINLNDKKWLKDGKLGLQHAYASTAFSSQGQTVDHAFVRDSVKTDFRQQAVAMSRHRETVDIFVARPEHLIQVNEKDIFHHHEISDAAVLESVQTQWQKNAAKSSTLDYLEDGGWRDAEGHKFDVQTQSAREEAQSLIERVRALDTAAAAMSLNQFVARQRAEQAHKMETAAQAARDSAQAKVAESPFGQLVRAQTNERQQDARQDAQQPLSPEVAQQQQIELDAQLERNRELTRYKPKSY